jgi:hypothetical protein
VKKFINSDSFRRAMGLAASALAFASLVYVQEYWSAIGLVPIVMAAFINLLRKPLIWIVALTVFVNLFAVLVFGCPENGYFIILPANYLLLTVGVVSIFLLVIHRPPYETLLTRLNKVITKVAAVLIVIANIPELLLLFEVIRGTAGYGVYLLPYTFSCHLFLIPAVYVLIKGRLNSRLATLILVVGAYWCAYLPLDFLGWTWGRDFKTFSSKLAWPSPTEKMPI